MSEKTTAIHTSEGPNGFQAFTTVDIPNSNEPWNKKTLHTPSTDISSTIKDISRMEQDDITRTPTTLKIVDLCSGNLVNNEEDFGIGIRIDDGRVQRDASPLYHTTNSNISSLFPGPDRNWDVNQLFQTPTDRENKSSFPSSEIETDYDSNTPQAFKDGINTGWIENDFNLTSHIPNKVVEQATVAIFMLITQPKECSIEEWNSLQTNLIVTHSETTSQVAYPITQNPDVCYQEVIEMPNGTGELVREISTYINTRSSIDNSIENLFQIFLAISNGVNTCNLNRSCWSNLEVTSFIQNMPTGQVIRPINQSITPGNVTNNPLGVFHASFTMHNDRLSHFLPTEATLIEQAEESKISCEQSIQSPNNEQVVIVGRADIIQEVNGARGGRPLHKASGQLLMTRQQVEKVLEIRRRWQGLSPRQRRDNVTYSDFYTFLTLNRDETADCLGVCATWLKDAIRSQGVHVWPGRPLRRTGAMLQSLKESLASVKAAMRFADPGLGQLREYQEEIQRLQNEIRDVLDVRMDIVKQNVSEGYFAKFVTENGKQFLDPDWIALPPSSSTRNSN